MFNLAIYKLIQMVNNIIVEFYEPEYQPDIVLTYSVIAATYKGKWVFVRHHKRSTFEIPGGHIEKGESSFQAAERELMEETGAINFNLSCISTYSVKTNNETGFGRLYYADINEIGDIPDISEIAEVILSDTLPENLTHPLIQPHLFDKVLEFLNN
jgi:8-oxo-dGTP diphosphatase